MYRRLSYILVVLLFICLCVSALLAQSRDDKAGSVGMKFLTFGYGARAAGMGEAYTALVDDASGFFWNPGALGTLDNLSVHFTWNQYLLDSKYFAAAVAYPIENFATVTVGVTVVDYGDVVETSFEATGDPFKRTGNTLSPSDLAIGVSLSKQLTDKFSIGGTVKFIREDLSTVTANGVAFDVGTIFDTGYRNIKIGATFTNFGPDISFAGDGFDGQDVPIPQSFRIGFSIDSGSFTDTDNYVGTLSFDLIKNADTVQRLAVGGEIDIGTYIQGRVGYIVGFDESKVSFGGGLHFDWDDHEVRADYAISTFDDFDNTDVQRFSLSINF